MSTFPELVAAELARARRKHPTPIHSLHEGYAVLLEELDEFWQEVKRQRVEPTCVLFELMQVAAMCQRVAEDCALTITPEKASNPT